MVGTKLTLAQAARAVRMRAVKIDERPDGLMEEPAGWNGTHWKLTLTRRTRDETRPGLRTVRRTWTVYWSQGSAYGDKPPEALDVLESLLLDVQGMGEPFECPCCGSWAEKVYKACVKAAREWGRFWDGVEIIDNGDET